MKSPGILIFAGTTEGRRLAEYASEHGITCYVSTATEYGKSILGDLKGIECISGRMDETEIEDFVKGHDIRLVIDADSSICGGSNEKYQIGLSDYRYTVYPLSERGRGKV